MKLKLYEYACCSTCQKARKFLNKYQIEAKLIPIVETPPSKSELRKMLELQGGVLKKLFNTSGVLYRELKISERWSSLSESEALELLAKNGKLIKRPFLIGNAEKTEIGLVGFSEKEWKETLKP